MTAGINQLCVNRMGEIDSWFSTALSRKPSWQFIYSRIGIVRFCVNMLLVAGDMPPNLQYCFPLDEELKDLKKEEKIYIFHLLRCASNSSA